MLSHQKSHEEKRSEQARLQASANAAIANLSHASSSLSNVTSGPIPLASISSLSAPVIAPSVLPPAPIVAPSVHPPAPIFAQSAHPLALAAKDAHVVVNVAADMSSYISEELSIERNHTLSVEELPEMLQSVAKIARKYKPISEEDFRAILPPPGNWLFSYIICCVSRF